MTLGLRFHIVTAAQRAQSRDYPIPVEGSSLVVFRVIERYHTGFGTDCTQRRVLRVYDTERPNLFPWGSPDSPQWRGAGGWETASTLADAMCHKLGIPV